MNTTIIGAGKMGQWFTRFFIEAGDSVTVSSRSEEKLSRIRETLGVKIADNVNAIKNADRVLICVPLENIEEVVKEICSHIRSNQVVMDICSIKEPAVKILHEYITTGLTLGTHPVFGPGVKSIKNQNFVLTPTNAKEEQFAHTFKSWLKEKQANVFLMSPKEHDELMAIVLGLPHFIGLVVCDTLINYPNFLETKKVAGASYQMLLTLAESVASEETEFYTSLQLNLPGIQEIEREFLDKSKEWSGIVKRKDRYAFADKMDLVKKKLKEINPSYTQRYETMHRFLDALGYTEP
jgi:prephenate dehydrogenase